MIPTMSSSSSSSSSSQQQHLLLWGSELNACATFVELGPSDVCAFRWDARAEMLVRITDADELRQHTHDVHQMRHDDALGPYPLAIEAQWRSLSQYIGRSVLRRAGIADGAIIEPGGIDQEELEEELRRATAAAAAAAAVTAAAAASVRSVKAVHVLHGLAVAVG